MCVHCHLVLRPASCVLRLRPSFREARKWNRIKTEVVHVVSFLGEGRISLPLSKTQDAGRRTQDQAAMVFRDAGRRTTAVISLTQKLRNWIRSIASDNRINADEAEAADHARATG